MTKCSVNPEQLIKREISLAASPDLTMGKTISTMLGEFRPVSMNRSELTQARSLMSEFLSNANISEKEEGLDDDTLPKFIKLLQDLDKVRAGCRLPPILPNHFEFDVGYASDANEAFFQRTIMMATFDRWNLLGSTFACSSEVEWNLADRQQIPSTDEAGMNNTKPDLVISFNAENFYNERGGFQIPPAMTCFVDMERTGFKRCFPFIIIEAKHSFRSLQPGLQSNLFRASQLLYNMFQWFSYADRTSEVEGSVEHRNKFFDHVRVFTITLNAKQLYLRTHRATKMEQLALEGYEFEETLQVSEPNGYRIDQMGHIVGAIMQKYGRDQLLPALKGAHDVLVKDVKRLQRSIAKKRAVWDDQQGAAKRHSTSGQEVGSASAARA